MVQSHKPKEVQRAIYYRVAIYCERNFETGRAAKELLKKPAQRAFLWVRRHCDMSRYLLNLSFPFHPEGVKTGSRVPKTKPTMAERGSSNLSFISSA